MGKHRKLFRGIATVNIFAPDLEKAKKWYSDLFEIEPYFSAPGYLEFRLGDESVEFGIIDAKYAEGLHSGNVSRMVLYWQVSDIDEAAQKIQALGGQVHQPRKDRGNGFVTESYYDPFGNILGIMRNPHYLEMRAGKSNES